MCMCGELPEKFQAQETERLHHLHMSTTNMNQYNDINNRQLQRED